MEKASFERVFRGGVWEARNQNGHVKKIKKNGKKENGVWGREKVGNMLHG